MKLYRGISGIDPLILNSGIRWSCAIKFLATAAFLQWKKRYSLNRRVIGLQRRSANFGETNVNMKQN